MDQNHNVSTVSRVVNGYDVTQKMFSGGETWFMVEGDTETHGRFNPMDCRVVFQGPDTKMFRVGFTGKDFYELTDAISTTVSMAMAEQEARNAR